MPVAIPRKGIHCREGVVRFAASLTADYFHLMTAIAERLDEHLRRWDNTTAARVEQMVDEIVVWADVDTLDLMRSRERDMLDLLDKPQAGRGLADGLEAGG
jgi:hypothetical protein